MTTSNKTLKVLVCVLLLSNLNLAACSSHSHTETKTEKVVHSDDGIHSDSEPVRVEATTSSETESTSSNRDHGLFSILGDIIALPFRAVGALLSAIF